MKLSWRVWNAQRMDSYINAYEEQITSIWYRVRLTSSSSSAILLLDNDIASTVVEQGEGPWKGTAIECVPRNGTATDDPRSLRTTSKFGRGNKLERELQHFRHKLAVKRPLDIVLAQKYSLRC